MARSSEREWEWAAGIFLGGLVLWKFGGVPSGRSLLDALVPRPALPKGTRLPGEGDMREVPRVRTALDPHGFPELFNVAFQMADSWMGPEGDVFSNWANLTQPEPSSDADLPGRVFASQAALETGDGKSVFHFNVGNLTTLSGDYYLNPPTDKVHHYEVFNYPLQGALAMLLRVKRLWRPAFDNARFGYIHEFAQSLVQGPLKYYEADPVAYEAGIRARARIFGWDAGFT